MMRLFLLIFFLTFVFNKCEQSVYLEGSVTAASNGTGDIIELEARSICECKTMCYSMTSCTGVTCSRTPNGFLAKLFKMPKMSELSFSSNTASFCKRNASRCLAESEDIELMAKYGWLQLGIVSQNKHYESSSRKVAYPPENAFDGLTNTGFGSASILFDKSPWLMVDLGEPYMVHQIRIIGRPDCCYDKAGNMKIYLNSVFDSFADFSAYPMILDISGDAPSVDTTYNCEPVLTGRYVILHRDFALPIQIRELEIIAVL